MKNSNFFFTIALALLVVFQSCKKNDVAEVAAPAAAQTENIAALQQAVANSFELSAEKVTYDKAAQSFVIDGDGSVSLEDAKARFSSNGTASSANQATQRKYSYIVSSTKINTIAIYADATVPAVWVAALDSAIKNWNASGSKVKMQRITTVTGATTTVTTFYNSASSVVASASYPNMYGAAGKSITINTYQNALVDSKKIFAITHELGHSIGMTHTNETSGTQI